MYEHARVHRAHAHAYTHGARQMVLFALREDSDARDVLRPDETTFPRAMHRDFIPASALCSRPKVLVGKIRYPGVHQVPRFSFGYVGELYRGYYLDIAAERKNFSESSALLCCALQAKGADFRQVSGKRSLQDNAIIFFFIC